MRMRHSISERPQLGQSRRESGGSSRPNQDVRPLTTEWLVPTGAVVRIASRASSPARPFGGQYAMSNTVQTAYCIPVSPCLIGCFGKVQLGTDF